MEQKNGRDYGRLVKALQIASGVFMLAMLALCVWFLVKNHINVKNVDALRAYLVGGVWGAAGILVGFSVVKSFALVFPPAVLFALSGVVFENFWFAIAVNAAATALSLVLPFITVKASSVTGSVLTLNASK